ncbi:MAG: ferredoxin family protein [Armatimonadota bacterium]|nr:ferredoxin family protein [Armatimonadota bacterium]
MTAATKTLTNPQLRVVLYEGNGSRPLADGDRAGILRTLLEKGYAISCSRAGGSLSAVASGALLVLGRFTEEKPPQAATESGEVTVYFRDVEGLDTAAVTGLVEDIREKSAIPQPGGWKPWFPVIDYSRCTNCMQCLSFCLFDVYGVSEDKKIQVQNQSNCKTDCPACSRVCPEVAILFPKYRQGPINGDEIDPEDLRREAMKVDISALLGGDIYAALRDRSAKAKSRFAKERDEDRALKERQRCLIKLQAQLDIPAEVLASLPSADEIRAKAEAAQVKAEDARRLVEQPSPLGPLPNLGEGSQQRSEGGRQ